jgi:serine/threonine protein kinase
MELVDGGSLTEVLEHTQPDDAQTALILRDSLEAIVFLHDNDIVHRDIKVIFSLLAILFLTCAHNRIESLFLATV